MAEEKLTAATRLEKILDNIAGGDNEITPATRLEKFLSYIADAMEGGGGSGGGEVPAPSVSEAGKTLRVNNAGQLEYVEDPLIVNMLPLPDDFVFPSGYDSGFYLDVLPIDMANRNCLLHFRGETGEYYTDIYSRYDSLIIPELSDMDKMLFANTFLSAIEQVNLYFDDTVFWDSYQGVTYNGYFMIFRSTIG